MKFFIALVCIFSLSLGFIQAFASEIQGVHVVMELHKKSYLSKKTIDFPAPTIVARRSYGTQIADTIAIEVKYLNKTKEAFETATEVFDIKNCRLVTPSDQCLKKTLNLNPTLFRMSCFLEVNFAGQTKQILWGNCEEDIEVIGDLKVETKFEEDIIQLNLFNVGFNSTEPFRALLVFLDNDDNELTYTFLESKPMKSGAAASLNFGTAYLYRFTCRLKVIIDPDCSARFVSRKEHFQVVQYGECEDEPFVPYVDVSLSLISESKDNVLLEIRNIGDVPVEGSALNIKIEVSDRTGKPLFRDRLTSSAMLAPKESIQLNYLFKSGSVEACSFALEINPTDAIFENNKNNNKVFINICN